MLEIGVITKPHGLQGDVVVNLWTNVLERLAPGSELGTASGRMLRVERSAPLSDKWLVRFEDVSSREQAEELRAVVLEAEPIDDAGTIWVHDLIGATVVDTRGNDLGQVESVEANPASDILVLEGGAMVPLHFVVSHGSGRLVVDPPPGLLD